MGQHDGVTDDPTDQPGDDESTRVGRAPTPSTDDDVARAPGGADATAEESDVGSGDTAGDLLIPDQPLSAQQESQNLPQGIQEPEKSDQSPTAEDEPESEEPD